MPGWSRPSSLKVAFVGALAGTALLVALRLARVPPPAHMLS